MKYAYIREGIVEFIEKRPLLETLYPESILDRFVPLTAEQEKFVTKGCLYDGKTFTEPEVGSLIPNIGGFYTPIRKE